MHQPRNPLLLASLVVLASAGVPAIAAEPTTRLPTSVVAAAPGRSLPAMPTGYATLFMGPPRGSLPVPPARTPPIAPAAAPPAAVPLPVPAGGPGALCRAAILTAEREHGLPPLLLAAIGRVESGRRDTVGGGFGPWPWTINAEGRGSFFPTRAAVLAATRQEQAGGVRSIDVGCMQVNLRHHPQAFATLEDAFEPLTNARYAARFLRELHAELGDWQRAAAAYHSRNPEFGAPYQAKVMAAWAEEKRQPAPTETAVTAVAAVRAAPSGPGAAWLSNNADRATTMMAGAPGGGRGLDAYRAAPISAIGRVPAVYNVPYRQL